MQPIVSVIGDKELIGKLRKLAKAGQGETVRKALYAGGLVIEGAAKQQIQAKDIIELGFLFNSVYTVTQDQSGYSGISVPPERAGMLLPEVKPDADEAIVAVGAEYGIYHEMGTSKMAARPFMRPAVAESKAGVGKAIGAVIKDALLGGL